MPMHQPLMYVSPLTIVPTLDAYIRMYQPLMYVSPLTIVPTLVPTLGICLTLDYYTHP